MDRIAPIEQPTSNQDKLHYNTVALKSAQRLKFPAYFLLHTHSRHDMI